MLGQDFLEDTQAFSVHGECFLRVETVDERAGINLVIWHSSRSNTNSHKSSKMFHATA